MVLHQYDCAGLFWTGSGCVNNKSVPNPKFILDDALEPYSFVANQWFQAETWRCNQHPVIWQINLRDKNAQLVNTIKSCYNLQAVSTTQYDSNCWRLGGATGLTITKGARVYVPGEPGYPTTPTKYGCINGTCALASQGIYNTVAECQATGCQPPGSPEQPINELCPECPPAVDQCAAPSICLSQQEARQIYRNLREANNAI